MSKKPKVRGKFQVGQRVESDPEFLFLKGCEYYKNNDYGQAVKYYRQAAEQGVAEAQVMLGYCYFKGYGVEKDAAETVRWCRSAAEQGVAGAQYCLGLCYESGYGVEKDAAEAVRWYRQAAEQGDEDAKKALENL